MACSTEMNFMTKSAKTCPFIAFFGLYLMSNSLISMAHFISLPEVSGLCNTCFMDILLELLWYEPESKGGASELQLLMLRLVFPSSDNSPPLLSELDCNSKLGAALGLCP